MTDFLHRIFHEDALIVADAAQSPTEITPYLPAVISIAHADHATETLVYKVSRKIEIVDVEVLQQGAGASNTVQVKDAAHAAISNAIAADTDKTVTRAGTLDIAKRTIEKDGTFEITFSRSNGSSACEVLLHVLLRA